MDPIAKRILNMLKCPICNGQIDLLDFSTSKRKSKDCNFCCVNDPEHFAIWLVHWEQPIRLELERAIVYEGKYQYEVIQNHCFIGSSATNTLIYTRKIDAENRVLESSKVNVFSFGKILFDFSKTDRKKLVNRIKTVLVFQ